MLVLNLNMRIKTTPSGPHKSVQWCIMNVQYGTLKKCVNNEQQKDSLNGPSASWDVHGLLHEVFQWLKGLENRRISAIVTWLEKMQFLEKTYISDMTIEWLHS